MFPNLDTIIKKIISGLTNSVSDLPVINIIIISFFPKLDYFLALIRQLSFKFDVFCFTECRQTESTKKSVNVHGNNDLYCPREAGLLGGGITVFLGCDLEIVEILQCAT